MGYRHLTPSLLLSETSLQFIISKPQEVTVTRNVAVAPNKVFVLYFFLRSLNKYVPHFFDWLEPSRCVILYKYRRKDYFSRNTTNNISSIYKSGSGSGSSVGIATGYGLDGPGIESRWGKAEIFRTCPDRPWGPPSLLYNGYRVFPGVKSGRDVTLTPHPVLVPWSWKGRAIPLLPLWAVRTEPQCLFRVALYL